jgi:hypothetical protein
MNGFSSAPGPWLIQSCTMNCNQAATRRLMIVAGWKVSRVSSSRLTTRGLGFSREASSGKAWARGTLRPKRRSQAPISGLSRL